MHVIFYLIHYYCVYHISKLLIDHIDIMYSYIPIKYKST